MRWRDEVQYYCTYYSKSRMDRREEARMNLVYNDLIDSLSFINQSIDIV